MRFTELHRKYGVLLSIVIIAFWTVYAIYQMHYESIHGFVYSGRHGNLPGDFMFGLKKIIIHTIFLITILLINHSKKKYWYLMISILTLLFFVYNIFMSMHTGSVIGTYLFWLLGISSYTVVLTILSFFKKSKKAS